MRQWFPFTDYEFYAYLTAGMFLLLGLDLSITGGAIMLRPNWPIVQIVMVVAAAYVAGQLIAGPSSTILEHFLARRVLHSPTVLLLGLAEPRWIEKLFNALFIGRNYSSFPPAMRSKLLASACKVRNVEKISNPEEVFNIAYPIARAVPDAVARMDQFLNLYGFCRNVAFVSLVNAICLLVRLTVQPLPYGWWMVIGALAVAIGMFGRFLKFYAAFAAEVLRTYDSKAAL